MYRATTPTHKFTIPFNTDLLKEIRITYQQKGENLLNKTEEDCSLEGNDIYVTLSQEDTLLFAAGSRVSVQLRVLTTNGQVMASQIEQMFVSKVLDDEVLQ